MDKKELEEFKLQEDFSKQIGDYNNNVVEVVNSMGYHCVQWDVDTIDIKVKKI